MADTQAMVAHQMDKLAEAEATKNMTPEEAKRFRHQKKKAARNSERQARLDKPMPVGFVIDSIDRSVQSKLLVRELWLYIPFMVSFMFFFLAGRSIGQSYFATQSLRDKFIGNEIPATFDVGPFWDKGFFDIALPGDWHDWAEGVLIPQIFGAPPVLLVTGANQLIGRLRIRTNRVRRDSCRINRYFYPPATDNRQPRLCYGKFSKLAEEVTPYGGPRNNSFTYTECLAVGQNTAGRISSYPCSSYTIEIPFSASEEEAASTVAELRTNGYLDRQATRFVIAEFFCYNPALDLFGSVKLFFEQTTGGAWVPTSRIRTFKGWTKADVAETVYGFYFFCFVLYYVVRFFADWKRSRKRHGSYFTFLTDIWNLLEIVNLLTFLVVFIFRWIWWSTSAKFNFVLPGPDEYPGDLERILGVYSLQVWLNSLNTVITWLKLLKYVRLNDQLNILTRTLATSASNIYGVLAIFFIMAWAFALTGVNIFGNGIEDYRDLNTAMSTLMRTLLGDFDYPRMRKEDRELAGLFFGTWVVLGLFLLLNFIIAVLADSFSIEHAKTKSIPLDEQIRRQGQAIHAFLQRPDKAKALLSLLPRRRRLPQVTVMQYLIAFRFDLHRSQPDKRQQQQAEEPGEVELPNPNVTRADLRLHIPPAEYKDIGSDFLDALWLDIVRDYDLFNQDDELEAQNTLEELEREAIHSVLRHLFQVKREHAHHHDTVDDVDIYAEEAAVRKFEEESHVEDQGGKYFHGDDLNLPNKKRVLDLFAPPEDSGSFLKNVHQRLADLNGSLGLAANILSVVEAKLTSVGGQIKLKKKEATTIAPALKSNVRRVLDASEVAVMLSPTAGSEN